MEQFHIRKSLSFYFVEIHTIIAELNFLHFKIMKPITEHHSYSMFVMDIDRMLTQAM